MINTQYLTDWFLVIKYKDYYCYITYFIRIRSCVVILQVSNANCIFHAKQCNSC